MTGPTGETGPRGATGPDGLGVFDQNIVNKYVAVDKYFSLVQDATENNTTITSSDIIISDTLLPINESTMFTNFTLNQLEMGTSSNVFSHLTQSELTFVDKTDSANYDQTLISTDEIKVIYKSTNGNEELSIKSDGITLTDSNSTRGFVSNSTLGSKIYSARITDFTSNVHIFPPNYFSSPPNVVCSVEDASASKSVVIKSRTSSQFEYVLSGSNPTALHIFAMGT